MTVSINTVTKASVPAFTEVMEKVKHSWSDAGYHISDQLMGNNKVFFKKNAFEWYKYVHAA